LPSSGCFPSFQELEEFPQTRNFQWVTLNSTNFIFETTNKADSFDIGILSIFLGVRLLEILSLFLKITSPKSPE